MKVKRFAAVLICVLMMGSLIPVGVFANDNNVITDESLGGADGKTGSATVQGAYSPIEETSDENDKPAFELDTTLDVRKTASDPKDGKSFKLGETITYTIVVTNKGSVSFTNVAVVDALTDLQITIEDLPVGGSSTFNPTYTVTEQDVSNGSVTNTVTAKADPIFDPKTGTEKTPYGEASVESAVGTAPEEPKGHMTINTAATSEPENGSCYALGEKISYKITATNDGSETLTDVRVTDQLTGDIWTINVIKPGASESFETSYRVTSADVLAGKVVNTASGTASIPDTDIQVEVAPDMIEVPTVDPDTTLHVLKTASEPADGKSFKLGETITYNIEVTNRGNVSYKKVAVDDELTGLHVTIEDLPAGGSSKFNPTYVVSESDVENGSVTNTVTAKAEPITDPKTGEQKIPYGEASVVSVAGEEVPKGHLTINTAATSEPENGSCYALGEEISYKITATNDGSVTLVNVEVTDQLTGETWTIASLQPGASQSFTTSHAVTEADILAGKAVNTVTGIAIDPVDPEKPVQATYGKDEQPTEPKDGHLTINKVTTSTPANGQYYVSGETIRYLITATNDGNLTLTNVAVNDSLTGETWTVPSMGPGENRTFSTAYVVTAADAAAGSVINVATGLAASPDPDKPSASVTPGTDPEPTTPINAHMTVTKTVTNKPANGNAYIPGETITYSITVTNDGNTPITDVTVTDPLTGGTWSIASLMIDASQTFTASYTVTDEDGAAGSVTNTATATGSSPNGVTPTVTPGTVETLTESAPAPIPGPTPKPLPESGGAYVLTKGAGSVYQKGSHQPLRFVIDSTIDGVNSYDNYLNAMVDNNVVPAAAEQGSTIVTFSSELLESLDAGTHNITFVFTDGRVETTLTIEPGENANSNTPTPSDITPADTGDPTCLPIWISMFTFSTAGFGALLVGRRRKKKS